ncbi:MAG: ChaN family lipoprotein [Thermodesulfovibrionales bacterium]|jgi:uncharacterized iron-regulated protein
MSGIFPGLMRRLTYRRRTAALRLFLSVILFQICFLSGACAEQKNVFRISDRQPITYEQMLDDLKNVRIIFVGEVHDREAHHQLQLDAIKALNDRKVPLSVGFEMFTYESQNDLDKWTEGSLPVETFIPIYYKNWNYPWTLYDDILFYVRDNKIPAIGLNVPAEITRKVSVSGFTSLTQEELKKLPSDVGCVVNEQYMQFIRRAYAMHGHGDKQFRFFCEAQLLWNQTMAYNIIEFLKKNPAKKIVVLTGNGHAWKKGIPEQVRTISEGTQYRVILPQIPGYVDPQTMTAGDADYILLQ